MSQSRGHRLRRRAEGEVTADQQPAPSSPSTGAGFRRAKSPLSTNPAPLAPARRGTCGAAVRGNEKLSLRVCVWVELQPHKP